MTRLRVAVTVPIFPNVVQPYILDQITTLEQMGVNITVIAKHPGASPETSAILPNRAFMDNVIYINAERNALAKELVSLPILKPLYRHAARKILKHISGRQYGLQRLLQSLVYAKALAAGPFDIVHSHSMFSSFDYLFMRQALSIPLITTYHGRVPRGVKPLDEAKLQMIFDKGDAFLANTEFAKSELLRLGCPGHKIHIIPQGLNLANFCFSPRNLSPDRKIIILTVGRLSIEKGHHVAINAIAQLAADFPSLEYHIVGSGPQRDHLMQQAKQYGLQDRVLFHGLKTGRELIACLSEAHLFVQPSIDTRDGYLVETQGVVLQEAQACGIPVIASRVGGIPDVIIDNETGLLFRESDHSDLAGKIKDLILDPDRYQALCKSARIDVQKRFDINIVSKQILSLYHSLSGH